MSYSLKVFFSCLCVVFALGLSACDNGAGDDNQEAANSSSVKSVSGDTESRRHTLTVSSFGGGIIKVTGQGLEQSCEEKTCSYNFNEGTEVSLIAQPIEHSKFMGWKYCDATSGTTCTVKLSSSTVVSATFLSEKKPAVKEKIVTLTDDQVKMIRDYSADFQSFRFLPNTDLTGIEVGTIIISNGIYIEQGHPENVEMFFARRIKSVRNVRDGSVAVRTEKVALDDIYKSGTLSTEYPDFHGFSSQ